MAMDPNQIEKQRVWATGEVVMRIVATTAIWSIVVVIGYRLRHPLIELTLAGVAGALTLLIWTHQPKK